mgnify:CR=1 FL=1
MKTARFEIRTDLALEEREGLKRAGKRSIRCFFSKMEGKDGRCADHGSEGIK